MRLRASDGSLGRSQSRLAQDRGLDSEMWRKGISRGDCQPSQAPANGGWWGEIYDISRGGVQLHNNIGH